MRTSAERYNAEFVQVLFAVACLGTCLFHSTTDLFAGPIVFKHGSEKGSPEGAEVYGEAKNFNLFAAKVLVVGAVLPDLSLLHDIPVCCVLALVRLTCGGGTNREKERRGE